jgi:predicted ATPase
MEAAVFSQKHEHSRLSDAFFAQDMSDGTLRALGLLIAMFQPGRHKTAVPVIGIEEPETGLHPAATGVLYDAIREASSFRQIITTSHSPDLLDRDDIPQESLLVARLERGVTTLRNVDSRISNLMREQLITPGELLRRNQLESGDEVEGVLD